MTADSEFFGELAILVYVLTDYFAQHGGYASSLRGADSLQLTLLIRVDSCSYGKHSRSLLH